MVQEEHQALQVPQVQTVQVELQVPLVHLATLAHQALQVQTVPLVQMVFQAIHALPVQVALQVALVLLV
jgi:hypothetical protein